MIQPRPVQRLPGDGSRREQRCARGDGQAPMRGLWDVNPVGGGQNGPKGKEGGGDAYRDGNARSELRSAVARPGCVKCRGRWTAAMVEVKGRNGTTVFPYLAHWRVWSAVHCASRLESDNKKFRCHDLDVSAEQRSERSSPNAFRHWQGFPEPRTGLRSGSGQVAELGTEPSVRFSRGSVRTQVWNRTLPPLLGPRGFSGPAFFSFLSSQTVLVDAHAF